MINFLHILPPELREAIFKPLLVDRNGKTPNLIKALRPDRKLYKEALGVFYRHNIFTFHEGNGWSFGDMAKEAVLSLDRVRICTGSPLTSKIMSNGLWEVGGSKLRVSNSDATDKTHTSLSDAENIRVVIIEYPSNGELGTHAAFPPFISFGNVSYSSNYFLLLFQNLKRVELILPKPYSDGGSLWTPLYDRWESIYGGGIELANERLGVLGKLSTVSALHFEEEGPTMENLMQATQLREVWFWQAEEGLFLKPPRPPPYTGALDAI
jgi:hypothetical protein